MATSQAERIFAKFGGSNALVRALKKIGKPRHRCTVESWARAKDDLGTGGTIPTHNWPDIVRAGRLVDVRITEKDMDPRPAN